MEGTSDDAELGTNGRWSIIDDSTIQVTFDSEKQHDQIAYTIKIDPETLLGEIT